MKNILKITGILSLVVVMLSVIFSFNNNTAVADESEYSCTVKVLDKNGDPMPYTKVSTFVSGGMFCEGGRDFETNQNGVATIKWIKSCNLAKLCVKGDCYNVENYEDGGSYTLRIDK